MRHLRYLALLAVLMASAVYSHAQVSVGIGVGPYAAYGPPVCSYGYYGEAPYACAPHNYYGPAWFRGGVFLGAGPWLRGGHAYGRGYGYRGVYGHGYGYRGYGHEPYGYAHGYHGGYAWGRHGYGGHR